jgi:hypothetical protein
MKRLISLALVFLPLVSQANNLYKPNEDALACHDYTVIHLIKTTAESDYDKAVEMLDYAITNKSCIFVKPNLIGRLVDFEGNYYQLNMLDHNVKLWFLNHQLKQ